MSDQPKQDESESGSKDEKPTFSRRSSLGVGGVGLASATGQAFAQRNGTNTTNETSKAKRGQQNGSGATNSTNSNGAIDAAGITVCRGDTEWFIACTPSAPWNDLETTERTQRLRSESYRTNGFVYGGP